MFFFGFGFSCMLKQGNIRNWIQIFSENLLWTSSTAVNETVSIKYARNTFFFKCNLSIIYRSLDSKTVHFLSSQRLGSMMKTTNWQRNENMLNKNDKEEAMKYMYIVGIGNVKKKANPIWYYKLHVILYALKWVHAFSVDIHTTKLKSNVFTNKR